MCTACTFFLCTITTNTTPEAAAPEAQSQTLEIYSTFVTLAHLWVWLFSFFGNYPLRLASGVGLDCRALHTASRLLHDGIVHCHPAAPFDSTPPKGKPSRPTTTLPTDRQLSAQPAHLTTTQPARHSDRPAETVEPHLRHISRRSLWAEGLEAK